MRDSKPQCDVLQHKLLEVTWFASNRDKPKTEASKQAFANNFFKMPLNYTQCMLSNWKICFNVMNIQAYDELFCNLSESNDTVV